MLLSDRYVTSHQTTTRHHYVLVGCSTITVGSDAGIVVLQCCCPDSVVTELCIVAVAAVVVTSNAFICRTNVIVVGSPLGWAIVLLSMPTTCLCFDVRAKEAISDKHVVIVIITAVVVISTTANDVLSLVSHRA